METTSDNRERTELGAMALDSEPSGDLRKRPRKAGEDVVQGIPKKPSGKEVPVRAPSPQRKWQMITVQKGSKNVSGDWILGDQVEVAAHPTICPQIWVTRPVDKCVSGYVLTHLQSGFALLWGFPDMRTAQYAAGVLADLLPVAEWNIVGEIEEEFKRRRVRALIQKLPKQWQRWIASWSVSIKSRTKKAEPDGSQDHEEDC